MSVFLWYMINGNILESINIFIDYYIIIIFYYRMFKQFKQNGKGKSDTSSANHWEIN